MVNRLAIRSVAIYLHDLVTYLVRLHFSNCMMVENSLCTVSLENADMSQLSRSPSAPSTFGDILSKIRVFAVFSQILGGFTTTFADRGSNPPPICGPFSKKVAVYPPYLIRNLDLLCYISMLIVYKLNKFLFQDGRWERPVYGWDQTIGRDIPEYSTKL